jgi:hypothetical protein
MVHHDAVGALLRLQVEALREAHADIFLRLKQTEDFCLIFQVGTGWVAEGVARAAIFLVE